MDSARDIIFGVIAFLFIIGSGIAIIAFTDAIRFVPDSDKLAEFNESFNYISAIEGNISKYRSGIEQAGTDSGIFGAINSLISTAWQNIKGLFKTVSVAKNIAESTGEFFGVPRYVYVLIGIALFVVVIFSILSAIFQRSL